MAKGKIYTRTGDKGKTGLLGGRRVSKDNAIIEALGAIDELNAILGTLELPELGEIQKDLMGIASKIAGKDETKVASGEIKDRRIEDRVRWLEGEIDRMEKDLLPLHDFILPAGQVHLARAVCRRCERRITGIGEIGKIRNIRKTQKYLNRLSDYLFVLARRENLKKGLEETVWLEKA